MYSSALGIYMIVIDTLVKQREKDYIFSLQTVKVKAEARLDLLRDVGVAVDTWIKSAMNQVMEELENERWATMTTQDASLSVCLYALIVINKRGPTKCLIVLKLVFYICF